MRKPNHRMAARVALRRVTATSAAIAAAIAAWVPAAGAAPATMLGDNPGECDIARALLGTAPPGCPPPPAALPPPAEPAPPTHAAPAEPDGATAPRTAAGTPPAPVPPAAAPPIPAPPVPAPAGAERRAAFLIAFDFASARIRPESRAVLDRVAAVMASPEGRGRIYRVIGHTDAVGPAAANLALSRRRAAAVVAYLTGSHGIPRDRLEAMGRGEEELADPAHPTAPANRRVEIVATGG